MLFIISGHGNLLRARSAKQPYKHKQDSSVDDGLVKIAKHNKGQIY